MTSTRHPSPGSTERTALEQRRRRGVRRTVLVVGIIAVGIYLAFIASGVFGVK